MSSHDNRVVLQSSTPCLVYDPAGTRFRENALQVSQDTVTVMIVVPRIRKGTLLGEQLNFARRSFNLSSSVHRNNKQADLLRKFSLDPGSEQEVIKISFSVKDPLNAAFSIDRVSSPEVRNLEDITSSDANYQTLIRALRTLERNIPNNVLDNYDLERFRQEEKKLFALVHSHAYHLASSYLVENSIPHFYHSSLDDHHTCYFDAQGTAGFDTAYLSGALKRFTGYVNAVQLAHFLTKHQENNALSSKAFFREIDLNDTAETINKLRQEKYTDDRKAVIHDTVALMKAGDIESQEYDFRQRVSILEDHLTHSAPLPKDAWSILLSSASTTEMKYAIFEHCTRNPQYIRTLFQHLNSSTVWDKKYEFKESLDPETHTLNFSFKVTDKLKGSSKSKSREVTGYKNFMQSRHALHCEVLQEICGVFSEDICPLEEPIPYRQITCVNADHLKSYIEGKLSDILKPHGIELELESRKIDNFVYRIISFKDHNDYIYTYETAPLQDGQKDNPDFETLEMLNYIQLQLNSLGIDCDLNNEFFNRKEFSESEQYAGLSPSLFTSRIPGLNRKSKKSTKIAKQILSYNPRLIGQANYRVEISFDLPRRSSSQSYIFSNSESFRKSMQTYIPEISRKAWLHLLNVLAPEQYDKLLEKEANKNS